MKRTTSIQRKQKGPPPAYRPNPVPKVLQAKMRTSDQSSRSASPIGPTPYRPQPKPRVLQTKTADVSATSSTLRGQTVQRKPLSAFRTAPAAPPVYSPQPKTKVLQTKQIAKGGLSGNTVQLSDGDKRRAKEAARQKAIKRSKEKKQQKTADNLVAYAGVPRKEAVAAAKSGVYVPGHHSDDSNSKMNDGTKKAVADYFAEKKKAGAGTPAKPGGDDDEPVEGAEVSSSGGGGGGGAASGLSRAAVEAGAKKAWNKAALEREDGLVAMTQYLENLATFQHVSREWTAAILADWGDFPPEEPLPD